MLTERWDGTSWAVQSVPRPPGAIRSALSAISCTAASACTAVGDYINGSGTSVPLAERWDGNAWTVQSVPYPAAGGSLAGVSCAGPDACTAVGQSSGASLAEGWNGAAWSIEGTPAGIGPLSAISCATPNRRRALGPAHDAEHNRLRFRTRRQLPIPLPTRRSG
jgi:hypothetical protein